MNESTAIQAHLDTLSAMLGVRFVPLTTKRDVMADTRKRCPTRRAQKAWVHVFDVETRTEYHRDADGLIGIGLADYFNAWVNVADGIAHRAVIHYDPEGFDA